MRGMSSDGHEAFGRLPDEQLVELARAGRPRAFEAIVARYRPELMRYCQRMGLSDSRVEDVLQSSFMSAWVALDRGVEVRWLRPWLYRIVRNTALNTMRAATPETASLLGEAASVDVPAADAELEPRLAARAALAYIAALPQMQRDAILMSAVDGRSHEEVATALGVSNGAVRGLLYRARAALRAAAMAVAPAPLVGRAAMHLGRLASGAQRIAEASTPGSGTELGGTLVKGAAVALSAAVLAGGAADVIVHEHHPHTAGPAAVASTGAPAAGPAGAPIGAAHGHDTSSESHREPASASSPTVVPRGEATTRVLRQPAPDTGAAHQALPSPNLPSRVRGAPAAPAAAPVAEPVSHAAGASAPGSGGGEGAGSSVGGESPGSGTGGGGSGTEKGGSGTEGGGSGTEGGGGTKGDGGENEPSGGDDHGTEGGAAEGELERAGRREEDDGGSSGGDS